MCDWIVHDQFDQSDSLEEQNEYGWVGIHYEIETDSQDIGSVVPVISYTINAWMTWI